MTDNDVWAVATQHEIYHKLNLFAKKFHKKMIICCNEIPKLPRLNKLLYFDLEIM